MTVVVSSPSEPQPAAIAAVATQGDQRGERRARASAHRGRRQLELELGAPAAARELERAVHPQRQLAGDRQAEAGAGDLVAGVEALEDALAGARVDARAVVGDPDGSPSRCRRLICVPTLIAVPSGVWVSALSIRIRMI